MRKNFGALSDVYPMPVFIVAAYDEEGKANCMNAAWGGIYEHKQIMVCLSHGHKTTKNIKESKAFTVSIADAKHVWEADLLVLFQGIMSLIKWQKRVLQQLNPSLLMRP